MNMIPKPWSEEYLRECVADEITLAFLHPLFRRRYTAPAAWAREAPILPAARKGAGLMSAGMSRLTFSGPQPSAPPCWRRSWDAAGPLGYLLGLTVTHDPEEGTVSAGAGNRRRNVTERYQDHPDQDAATFAAIVRAAIQELEARAGC